MHRMFHLLWFQQFTWLDTIEQQPLYDHYKCILWSVFKSNETILFQRNLKLFIYKKRGFNLRVKKVSERSINKHIQRSKLQNEQAKLHLTNLTVCNLASTYNFDDIT